MVVRLYWLELLLAITWSPGSVGELAPDLVGDAVGEVLVGRVAQVLEREHGEQLGARPAGSTLAVRAEPAEQDAESEEESEPEGERHGGGGTAGRGRRSIAGGAASGVATAGVRRRAVARSRLRSSARANSAAVAKRSAGDSGERLATACVDALRHGRPAAAQRLAAARCSRRAIIACAVGPVNGGSPASIS